MNIKKIIGAGFILLGTRLAICIIKKLLQNSNHDYDPPEPYDPDSYMYSKKYFEDVFRKTKKL